MPDTAAPASSVAAAPSAAPSAVSSETGTTGVAIHLQDVTKQYAGQARPAVDHIDLEIRAGEMLMLVGPSGCGKTTTLKMINRLIEPSSGRIVVGGEDVTTTNPDWLRRRIGYVIQAGGLFPHMTVGANVALVPGMLRWDKARTAARVDELLELVGLDPATYRDRYPRELSGGQQQRVGVARALAADPPVLLMDEPFGAVDPITRQRLQDELLNLQEELGKTIVMVTHDFDEAVKLGDRIAILDVGARVVQLDTPEEILANPAEDFVADFIGKGAALKTLSLTRMSDLALQQGTTAQAGESGPQAAARARQAGDDHVAVLDGRGRPLRWHPADQLAAETAISAEVDEMLPTLARRSTLSEALDTMLTASQNGVIVTGRRDAYLGYVTVDQVMSHMTPEAAGASS
ncbi:betaine/proline/choline family ABC transporter ATP-binding protein [Georgenia daeguensis]|uniref:Betaine/proline/choline family ABC transporter ATP-binding protein n=1 Tax=Georgenia daeguensis TaxID=908355 RepID=A0ABP8EXB8_9MICO